MYIVVSDLHRTYDAYIDNTCYYCLVVSLTLQELQELHTIVSLAAVLSSRVRTRTN